MSKERELKPFDKLLDDWKRVEGFTVWVDDHAGVLRNLSAYVERHTSTPDNTAMVQATRCAICLDDNPFPLRRDEMGGYVCLTCADKRLDTQDALVRQLVEALEYIECLDVNPSTYQDLGAVKRLYLASARCRKALAAAKEYGF